jgi:diadenosine tetraphosphate (Ap4A) HIT family hydrolase|nr:MAG TPA: hypothetical protein [Caudoviricetes sp.]
MKSRWNLEIAGTKQIMGGFIELTQEMTEKQMIAYVRKIARKFMTYNRDVEKYGIWVEKEGTDDYSFHIEARRNWKGGIDFTVWDTQKNKFIVDTARDRYERENKKYEEEMRKIEESMHSL